MDIFQKTIKHLISGLSDKEKGELIKEENQPFLHHGFGMNIRNRYKLWEGGELKDYFIQRGITHPDDMSQVIIEELKNRIKNPVVPSTEDVNILTRVID